MPKIKANENQQTSIYVRALNNEGGPAKDK